ncbi:MAG: hypothetical protein RIB46_09975 [Pseudomonadales bacterium]
MDGYIQTGIGIFVSTTLFLFTYRQTIGARRERARNANDAIRRSILRRMVLEKYAPSTKDISRVIEGKAREFRVPTGDLYSEEQILNTLFTDVFDSDLLLPEQRVDVESRLQHCIDELEKQPLSTTFEEFREISINTKDRFKTVTALALSASALGAVTSVLITVFRDSNAVRMGPELLSSVLGVLVGSLAILAAITTFRRSRDLPALESRHSALLAASQFEAEVAKVLQQSGLEFETEANFIQGDMRYVPDFIVTLNDKRIAVEAKSWAGSLPIGVMKRAISSLTRLSRHPEVDHVILVTNRRAPVGIGTDDVSVVGIDELVSRLRSVAG